MILYENVRAATIIFIDYLFSASLLSLGIAVLVRVLLHHHLAAKSMPFIHPCIGTHTHTYHQLETVQCKTIPKNQCEIEKIHANESVAHNPNHLAHGY